MPIRTSVKSKRWNARRLTYANAARQERNLGATSDWDAIESIIHPSDPQELGPRKMEETSATVFHMEFAFDEKIDRTRHEDLVRLIAKVSQSSSGDIEGWVRDAYQDQTNEAGVFVRILDRFRRQFQTVRATRKGTEVESGCSFILWQHDKSEDQNWFRDPERILSRLENPETHSEDLSKAVLFAEITPFTDAQRPRLLTALHRYITENRFSQEENTITHVASAIRKYAMNMDEERFEGYAEWFELTDTQNLACDIELELAQAVVSRILYEPFDTATVIPRLGERLVGLASDYMTRRQILQKSYDAVVLNATMGAILLDAPGADRLIESVRKLKLPWFEELLLRRLKRQATDLPEDQTELKRRLTQWLPQGE